MGTSDPPTQRRTVGIFEGIDSMVLIHKVTLFGTHGNVSILKH